MIDLIFPRCAEIGYARECAWTFVALIGGTGFFSWYLWIGLRIVHGEYVWLIDGLILGKHRPKAPPTPKERYDA